MIVQLTKEFPMASKLPIVYPSRARAVLLEVANDPKLDPKDEQGYIMARWREVGKTFGRKMTILVFLGLPLELSLIRLLVFATWLGPLFQIFLSVFVAFALVCNTVIALVCLSALRFDYTDEFIHGPFLLNLSSSEFRERMFSRRRPLLGYVLSVAEQIECEKKRVGEQLTLTVDACVDAIKKLDAHRLLAEGISVLIEEYALIVHSVNKKNEQSRAMEEEIREHQIAVFEACDLCVTSLRDLIPRIRLASELDALPNGVADVGAVEGVWYELELEIERQVTWANECLCKALIPLPQTAQISATPSRPATSSAIRRIK